MEPTTAEHVGWIAGAPMDAEHLRSLGIALGPYDPRRGVFLSCLVTDSALEQLAENFFGAYYWGLILEHHDRGVV